MKSLARTLLALLAIISAQYVALAQADVQQEQLLDIPHFNFEALSFAAEQPDSSRLDVYVEVPYEQLHFTNDDGMFRSNYDVAIDVFDADNKLVLEKSYAEKVETKDYNESVSTKQADLSQRSFLL